jgi:hypothetical protein
MSLEDGDVIQFMELISESTSRATSGATVGAGSATGDPAIDAGRPTLGETSRWTACP